MSGPPRATFRVQLNAAFDFDAAARLADHLAHLGVSHLYTSPCLRAVPGSAHGYDVVDHEVANPELGGEAGHARLTEALRAHGLGRVIDVVPNHMAIHPENRWWWDVLENGQASRYADAFDVDWSPADPPDRVLVPVLGDHFGRVLEAGELEVRYADGFVVCYFEHRLPLAPESTASLVRAAAERLGADDMSAELRFIADALAALPSGSLERATRRRRHRDKEVLGRLLQERLEREPAAARALEAVLAETNADTEALEGLLERQHHRLAWWRLSRRELSYRRFFDINHLVALRVEEPDVFDASHERILQWVARGDVDGLRIDHPDGLLDPAGYLRRLRSAAPEAWIVVEKILEPGEALRGDWPVAGTTGYDFLARVTRLLVDPAGEEPLDDAFRAFSGFEGSPEQALQAQREAALRGALAGDVRRLVDVLEQVCARHRRHRDHSLAALSRALVALVSRFPVYRTYLRVEGDRRVCHPEDAAHIEAAVEAAVEAGHDPDLLAFLAELLRGEVEGALELEVALRAQQLTAPTMAKGKEDTFLYVYNRLTALNEVGVDPLEFGVDLEAFHAANRATQARWPDTMNTLSTHDTKRSADVRARLLVLAERPERWREAVAAWRDRNEALRADCGVDGASEYLLYQTWVGAWPIAPDRLQGALRKAAREAKQRTSWADPDADFEAGLERFVAALADDAGFTAELARFVDGVRGPGRRNALAQTLLLLTCPGVPDLYQGDTLWNLSLVDPDNRRPVDFDRRRALLEEVASAGPETMRDALDAADDPGRPKLWLIHRALAVRARCAEAFGAEGDYRALLAEGEDAERVVAFVRGERAISVATRWPTRGEIAPETALRLPEGDWRCALSEERFAGRVAVADLLRRFPVALLERTT